MAKKFKVAALSLLSVPFIVNAASSDTIVVTASSVSKESYVDAPATITVITQEDIEKKPVQNLVDILREVPGIQFTDEGDNRKGVSMRGLESGYTLILVDGKRVNSRNAVFRHNDYDLSWIPTVAIERIEVIRGPMSSLYGADALGGVVNIITKKNSNTWHGTISADTTIQEDRNHGDTYKGGFFASGPLIQDKLDVKVYGSLSDRGKDKGVKIGKTAQPGFEGYTSRDANVDFKWTPDDKQEINFGYGFNRQDRDSDSLGDTRLERQNYSIDHRGRWKNATTELRFYGEDIDNYTTNKVKSESKVVDGKVIIPLFDNIDMLTIGGEYKYDKLSDKGNLKGDGSTNKKQFALFAENELYIAEPLILTTGLRMDHHEDFGEHYSPRVYLVYSATDSITVKGGWSSAFKAPSLLDLSPEWQTYSCRGACSIVGTPDLDPETSQNIELGLYYKGHEGILDGISGNVTVYQNDVKDMININRTGNAALAPAYPNFVGWTKGRDGKDIPVFKYYNVDKARIRGIETGIKIPFLEKQFELDLNYTYTDARDKTNNTPLSTRPFNNFNTTVNWYPNDLTSIYLSAHYQGKSRAVSSRDVPRGGYTMWNLGGSYKVTNNIKLRTGVLNLFDKTMKRADYSYNEEGRRYFLAVDYTF
ncbi:catecholate siderophore receptor CirA [Xenorhabdus sp. PR6a]|uniref:catecholate siderophore receptor CirA n=1 Tax=Xenorhabdus sp. PR6a TaxID=3025877 RepID=UPI002358491F|nr:catecholate siderophore receptor CirA [Xenorhabdus sp. PR6a]MDC9582430.1 catecholate siderophore receptor CirA [Xenorhabdus sp. PR6a]